MPEPDLLSVLHHVALGTVADVAPLIGLNRAFVAKGLIAMRRRDHVGHTALMDVARLNGPPEAWHLGFMLGPRINAGGRIGRADLGVRLLLEGDVSEAARIAAELDRLNTERRVIEQAAEAQAEAEALASLGLEDKGAVIVTAAEGWHPGVVGLVAARLKEKFARPAFAIALEPGGIGTGSGRSIGETRSTAARTARPVPSATMTGVSERSVISSRLALRSAIPAFDSGAAGSVGTTSQCTRSNRAFRREASSMQAAMGCSRRNVISRSARQSDTRRCAEARDTCSIFAISSWVCPAMKYSQPARAASSRRDFSLSGATIVPCQPSIQKSAIAAKIRSAPACRSRALPSAKR